MIIRPAVAADQRTIWLVVLQVRVLPLGLDWRRFLVAEEDDRVVGVGQIMQYLDGSCVLASLAVVPEKQRQGFGSAIVRALISRAHGKLHLFCRVELETFYRRFGFRRVPVSELSPSLAMRHRLGEAATRFWALLTGRCVRIICMRRDQA